MIFENPFLSQVHFQHPAARKILFRSLLRQLTKEMNGRDPLVLCIGTDRLTGDCLGPLVGYHLKNDPLVSFPVYGTLKEPVHGVNLKKVLAKIQKQHQNPYIIAVDAALSEKSKVGRIRFMPGALRPGAGLYKNLPEVGDFHIIGNVNELCGIQTILLQNTRLGSVMEMAELISSVLAEVLFSLQDQKESFFS